MGTYLRASERKAMLDEIDRVSSYAELKDGRIGDISRHIIFRKENPR